MAKKDWNAIATKEFKAMSKDYQDDWQDLRKRVMGRN